MALLGNDSCCSLCGELLGDSNNWIATTMVALDPPLSRMVDTAAHNECLRSWEHKEAFVNGYNSRWSKPELRINHDGYVQNVRHERPMIAWYIWMLMPVLLPLGIVLDFVESRRGRRR
jgi:hypothetical protein